MKANAHWDLASWIWQDESKSSQQRQTVALSGSVRGRDERAELAKCMLCQLCLCVCVCVVFCWRDVTPGLQRFAKDNLGFYDAMFVFSNTHGSNERQVSTENITLSISGRDRRVGSNTDQTHSCTQSTEGMRGWWCRRQIDTGASCQDTMRPGKVATSGHEKDKKKKNLNVQGHFNSSLASTDIKNTFNKVFYLKLCSPMILRNIFIAIYIGVFRLQIPVELSPEAHGDSSCDTRSRSRKTSVSCRASSSDSN